MWSRFQGWLFTSESLTIHDYWDSDLPLSSNSKFYFVQIYFLSGLWWLFIQCKHDESVRLEIAGISFCGGLLKLFISPPLGYGRSIWWHHLSNLSLCLLADADGVQNDHHHRHHCHHQAGGCCSLGALHIPCGPHHPHQGLNNQVILLKVMFRVILSIYRFVH